MNSRKQITQDDVLAELERHCGCRSFDDPDLYCPAHKSLYEREKRREELYWALRTRVLTAEEVKDVRAWGYMICVNPRESHRAEDIKREFNEALVGQFMIHLAACKHES